MQYPLQIYVVWQPESKEKAKDCLYFHYAQQIFSAFNREIEEPLARGIGIPTYFVSEAEGGIGCIDWEAAQYTTVIWFVENNMIINKKVWEKGIQNILEQGTKALLLPIAMVKYFQRFNEEFNQINWIKLFEKEEKERVGYLLEQLTFSLAQLLYDPSSPPETKLPLKVFISHARNDGQKLAKHIKRVIYELESHLEVFLDVRNITNGASLCQAIQKYIEESIILVVNTNLFNEREWCIKELVIAKKKKRPVVVVNTMPRSIKRVLPYIGNIPMIQLFPENLKVEEEQMTYSDRSIEDVVYKVLQEALRYIYQDKLLKERAGRRQEKVEVFAVAPELLTVGVLKEEEKNLEHKKILYPDPPLGDIETRLIHSSFGTSIITPTLYPLLSEETIQQEEGAENLTYETLFKEFTIGLSISETPSTIEGNYTGVSRWHIQDAMIELARYLFVCGANCAYGGDIEYPTTEKLNLNFARLLIELLESYNSTNTNKRKVINHISAGIENISALKAEYEGTIEFTHYYHLREQLPSPTNEIERHAREALFLTDMRQAMYEKNEAQIFIAGKIPRSMSIIPGVLEEAYWAIKKGKPIYIIGAFGGVSAALADLFQNGNSPTLRKHFEEEQQKKAWKQKYQKYKEYIQQYTDWGESIEDIDRRVDYASIKLFFLKYRSRKKNGAKYLDNGLSREENEILFKSKNILEISSLILKGLHEYFNK